MKKLLFIFYSGILSFFSANSQDSCTLRISLLTCAPGEELYSTFGHTALRVQDRVTGTDHVFNYGTFEFGPDFYAEFIQGKLLYFLSVQEFEDFMYQYQYESRSVQEQVIQISCENKQKLLEALNENAEESNRYYRYDFLFDNCTTRAKDIVKTNSGMPVVFRNILPENIPSFRDLIHSYLDKGRQPWSKLGIDILLGADLDNQVTNEQAMFLPDYLLKGFDSATIGGQPLVGPAVTILQMPSSVKTNSILRPAIVFSFLLVVIVIISFNKRTWAIKFIGLFDFLFFFLTGLAGLLLLFMWFGTNHEVCGNNFNLLWAFPPNVVMAFFVHSNKTWVRSYFRILCWMSSLLLITWFFLPQDMNEAILPILLLIIYRSWYLSKNRHAKTVSIS